MLRKYFLAANIGLSLVTAAQATDPTMESPLKKATTNEVVDLSEALETVQIGKEQLTEETPGQYIGNALTTAHIFRFLPSIRDLHRASLVCKDWCDLVYNPKSQIWCHFPVKIGHGSTHNNVWYSSSDNMIELDVQVPISQRIESQKTLFCTSRLPLSYLYWNISVNDTNINDYAEHKIPRYQGTLSRLLVEGNCYPVELGRIFSRTTFANLQTLELVSKVYAVMLTQPEPMVTQFFNSLRGLASLRQLSLGFRGTTPSRITTVTHMSWMPSNLDTLELGFFPFTFLDSITDESNIDGESDSNQENMGKWPDLRVLRFGLTLIESDARPLANFRNLRTLSIYNTRGIRDIPAIVPKLRKLTTLSVSEDKNLTGFDATTLSSLTHLILSHTSISSALELTNCGNIRFLDLSGTCLTSLDGIEDLKALEILYLHDLKTEEYNHYDDERGIFLCKLRKAIVIKPLTTLKLRILKLTGTRFSWFSDFYQMPHLRELYTDTPQTISDEGQYEELRRRNPSLEVYHKE